MADEQRVTYPNIPAKHWWSLRKKFQQSIPSQVTPGYLATTLDMKEGSARTNIIPTLVTIGIINQDGVPQERAKHWRDDEKYPKVCEEIRKEIYPQELLDAIPGPSIDRAAVERWFANKTGVGTAAAKRMAVVYELLCEADPSKVQENSRKPSASKTTRKTTGSSKVAEASQITSTPNVPEAFVTQKSPIPSVSLSPSLHIDIQIHISSDASPDQIDQIFASMAKHLYKQVS